MTFIPELGQMVFGNPHGEFALPSFAEACIEHAFQDIERVYWNINQAEWNRDTDPEFPGIEYRPYYWGDDESIAAKPNLSFGGVEVRWYKHFGRGTTCSVEWTPDQWSEWHLKLLEAIRAAESKSRNAD